MELIGQICLGKTNIHPTQMAEYPSERVAQMLWDGGLHIPV